MSQILIARAIAVAAHHGQKYGTRPYTYHLSIVADRVAAATQNDEGQIAAAWLHDVMEDTKLTANDLTAAGVAPGVIKLVTILTRLPNEDYSTYIGRVAQNRSATRIKLADLSCHLDHNPVWQNRAKYEGAHARLLRALNSALHPHSGTNETPMKL